MWLITKNYELGFGLLENFEPCVEIWVVTTLTKYGLTVSTTLLTESHDSEWK